MRADHVGAQTAFQSRIESYVAGRVEDDVDVFGDRFGFLFREAEIVFRNVAADDGDFISNKIVERGAVTLAHRIKRRRADDVFQKRVSDSSCERARTVT